MDHHFSPDLIAFMVFLLVTGFMVRSSHGQPKFPAIFVFGDSTLDAGNNNVIGSPVKANFPPYGRDFPGRKATGRFSNGKLVSDFLASNLGIKQIVPAYLDPNLKQQDLKTGVTFASSAAGYDDYTSITARALTLTQQINNFNEYKTKLQALVGAAEAQRIVSQSIYLVASGSADIAVSFYNDRAPSGIGKRASEFHNIDAYVDFLVSNGMQTITKLYNAGARKVLVPGLAPIGCSPAERTIMFLKGQIFRPCNETFNAAAEKFNQQLSSSIFRLQGTLAGSVIRFSENYSVFSRFLQNPLAHGFLEVTRGCCGTGLFEIGTSCRDAMFSCPNADLFLFWDTVHPTQKAYQLIAQSIISNDIPRLL